MLRRVNILCFGLVFGLLTMTAVGAYAQRANDSKSDQKGQDQETGGTIGAYTAKILTDAIKALNMNDYKGAQAKLDTLKLERLSPYELSRVQELMAQISNGEGDNTGTREHLQKAVDAGGLNQQEVQQVKYQIASLYIVDGKYKEGAAALEEWFKTEPMPSSQAYYMLAVAYYQLSPKDDRAFRAAKKCVDLMDTPNTGWMELLLAMYVERQDFKDAITLSERMIAVEPKNKNYWVSLSSYYQAISNYDQALATLQTAYNGGLLTDESEYRRLAQMAAYDGAPYRCGQILEKAIEDKKIKPTSDDYATLSNCWISAREFTKSIPPLERAAQLSNTGDLYVRLAQVHMQSNDWAAAADALQKGIAKGKLDDPANAQLLMGVVLYSQSKMTEAGPYFERAAKSAKYRDTASSYLRAIAAKNKGS